MGSSTANPAAHQAHPADSHEEPLIRAGDHEDRRPGRLLTVNQACARAGVSRRTIYNWIAAGKVDWIRSAGGGVRIYEHTLWRSKDRLDAIHA